MIIDRLTLVTAAVAVDREMVSQEEWRRVGRESTREVHSDGRTVAAWERQWFVRENLTKKE